MLRWRRCCRVGSQALTETGYCVHDFKTSSRTYTNLEADVSIQATCYVVAAEQTYGSVASFRYSVLVKTKKAKVQHVDTSRSPEDQGRLGDLIQTLDRAIELGVYYPVESPLNCSGCSYRRQCRDWGTKVRPESLVPLGLPPKADPCSSRFTTKPARSVGPPRKANSAAPCSSAPRART